MTMDPQLDPLLRSWLKERVSVPSPGGLADTLEALASTSQRRPLGLRAWVASLPQRAAPMGRLWRLVILLVALALATGALLLAGGGSPSPIARVVSLTPTTVAPGVERITVYLGSEEMTYDWAQEVEVGADGSIWILGQNGLMKVGAAGIHATPPSSRQPLSQQNDPTDLTAGPDATVWVVNGWGQLERFDGSVRTSFAPPDPERIQAIDVDASGTVWAMWIPDVTMAGDRDMGNRVPTIAWLDGDDLVALPTPIGPASSLDRYGRDFAVTADGSPWLGVATHSTNEPELWRGLVTWDGEAWTVVRPVVADQDVQAGPMAAGSDGTLWVYFDACIIEGVYHAPHKDDCSYAGDGWTYHTWLGRFDGSTWFMFSEADGVPKLTGTSTYGSDLKVGADGTLWIGASADMEYPVGSGTRGTCHGVLSFDGVRWGQYLIGTCVDDLAIGPDGNVWASSNSDPTDSLYRIDPAAAR